MCVCVCVCHIVIQRHGLGVVFVEFIEVQDVNEYLALKSEENGHFGQRPLQLSLVLRCHV